MDVWDPMDLYTAACTLGESALKVLENFWIKNDFPGCPRWMTLATRGPVIRPASKLKVNLFDDLTGINR